jgi:hypothetical protein
MKKILLLVSCGLVFGVCILQAQGIVSTIPSKKKVVFEEFTAKHCSVCPRGTKKAHDYQETNPNNIFLIHVHVSSLAAGHPDYRTSTANFLES